jgi:hypothetical protein
MNSNTALRVVAAMMRRWSLALILLAASTPVLAQPLTSASAAAPAREIFERDWVLMNWALKSFDTDRDILLSPAEAQAAATAFRKIADGNGDGRITPEEYRAARAFILARY